MHPLDNVIWQALTTRQAGFAEVCDQARRFPPDVTSLTAFLEPNPRGYSSLAGLLAADETAILSLVAAHQPTTGWEVVVSFPGLQMVCENGGVPHNTGSDSASLIEELGPDDATEMFALAALTKPGPFGTRTYELGTYLGLRHEGNLIAMAGERLKVPGYTEISAVCTHPEHLGKGYARVLMSELMRRIRERGETAFLHVRQNNTRAITLYERLGFRTRMIVQFTVLRKVSDDRGRKESP